MSFHKVQSGEDDHLSRNQTVSISGLSTPECKSRGNSDLAKTFPPKTMVDENGKSHRSGGGLCCLPFFFSRRNNPDDLVSEPVSEMPHRVTHLQSATTHSSSLQLSLERSDSELRAGSSGVGATWYRKMREANLKEDLIDGLQGNTSEETEVRMRKAFDSTDADMSGGINAAELHEALRRIDIKATEEEARSMVREADMDGNGEIEYPEFRIMVLRLMAQQNITDCHCKGGEMCTCGAAHPSPVA